MDFVPERAQTVNPNHCYVGLGGFLIALLLVNQLSIPPIAGCALFVVLTMCPIAYLDFRQIPRLPIIREAKPSRVLVKCFGLACILAAFSLVYLALPFRYLNLYEPFYLTYIFVFLGGLVLALPYFRYWDRRLKSEKCAYFILGSVILGRQPFSEIKRTQNLLAGWTVKAFFAPLMLGFLAGYAKRIAETDFSVATFAEFYFWCITIMFCIDTTYGLSGYLLTFRSLNSKIKSVEPTFLGWACTLVCYPPFNQIWHLTVHYSHGKRWYQWFENNPVLGVTWGFVMLVLTGGYVWATISFGIRFSNLTNRGIITHGPYQFTKHPAYITKNMVWWMTYLPFMGFAEWMPCVLATLLLILMNVAYWLRAKTEEKHLNMDPEYLEYCANLKKMGLRF